VARPRIVCQPSRPVAGLEPSPIAPAPQPAPAQPAVQSISQPTSQPTGALPTALNQPTFDPPQFYEQAYASSGIRDIESDLNAKTMAYNEQVAKIKDNPYLSEATMTGRISKLEQKFSADRQAIQSNIVMRKADIETQLNLQLKKFDIQSQQAKQAFEQANDMLQAGMLDGASGEDIAKLTRTTGISSTMWQSAIGVSRKKNAPKVNTQVIQVDDGTNISAVVINQDTGEVINKQILSASKPKEYAPKEPKAATVGEQKASVLASVNSYSRSQAAQNNISPEDLFQKLLQSFPDAFDYINEDWSVDNIRAYTQKNMGRK